ncbi:MAG: hypothetical protein ACRC1R_00725 [Cetobacterium sp.]
MLTILLALISGIFKTSFGFLFVGTFLIDLVIIETVGDIIEKRRK